MRKLFFVLVPILAALSLGSCSFLPTSDSSLSSTTPSEESSSGTSESSESSDVTSETSSPAGTSSQEPSSSEPSSTEARSSESSSSEATSSEPSSSSTPSSDSSSSESSTIPEKEIYLQVFDNTKESYYPLIPLSQYTNLYEDPTYQIPYYTSYAKWHGTWEEFDPDIDAVRAYIENHPDRIQTIAGKDRVFIYLYHDPIDYSVTYLNVTPEENKGNPETYNVKSSGTLVTPPNSINPGSNPETGKYFLHWADEEGNVVTSLPIAAPRDITLTAVWNITHSITYSFPEGLLNDKQNPVIFSEGATSFDLKPLVPSNGFTFNGWRDAETDALVVTIDPASLTHDISLYADVTLGSITVSYYVDGNLYQTNSVPYEKWKSYQLIEVPKKAGYGGDWATEDDSSIFTDIRYDAEYWEWNCAVYLSVGWKTKYKFGTLPVDTDKTYREVLPGLLGDDYEVLGLFDNKSATSISLDAKMDGKDIWVQARQTLHVKTGEELINDLTECDEDDAGIYRIVLDADCSLAGYTAPLNLTLYRLNILDGQNHVISGFKPSVNDATGVSYKDLSGQQFQRIGGLFSENRGIIRNLRFEDCDTTINAKRANVITQLGFLAAVNDGSISNIHFSSSDVFLTTGTEKKSSEGHCGNDIGLIAAANTGDGVIEDIKIDSNVHVDPYSFNSRHGYKFPSEKDTNNSSFAGNNGLICGYNAGRISRCLNAGYLSIGASCAEQYDYVYFDDPNIEFRCGGIVGSNEGSGIVEDCLQKGAVYFNVNYQTNAYGTVGGIAGLNFAEVVRCAVQNATIEGKVANPRVTQGSMLVYDYDTFGGTIRLGGIVGEHRAAQGETASIIENCYTLKTTLLPYAKDYAVGGLVGKNASEIAHSFSTGVIQGNVKCKRGEIYYGGFIGYNATGGNVHHCVSATQMLVQDYIYDTGRTGVFPQPIVARFANLMGDETGSNNYRSSSVYVKLLEGDGIPLDYSTMSDFPYVTEPAQFSSDVAAENFITASFYRDTLGFNEDFFLLENGSYPALKTLPQAE